MRRSAKAALVAGLLAVVLMAFRVSWNALRDVAHTIGADHTAAVVYPLVVDGLMALALVATLVLPDEPGEGGKASPRRFALRVLASYTLASLVLNYVHGLTAPDGARIRLADWPPANWALVLLGTSLPVGSIFFGSDLVAKVLHHRPDSGKSRSFSADQSIADLPEPAPASVSEPVEPPAYVTPTDVPTAPLPAPAGTAPKPARRPRPATGPLPTTARTPRPTRTPADLLTEARELTADWPNEHLSAERIRKAAHTSAANARMLRDLLLRERQGDRPELHAVPDLATASMSN
ncbi:DUF2637 domain-containing protein [Streptacidiphilus rugosus]|uniref:DUF2637 domain-containing protein n=1 Tax=Streptacidiphilus rugosus TaxID=405783 RepID=UPI00068AEBEC|nr:DUF2637 domain-containing protein [Streptacidiphilus rugosus]